jgi:hypothetical protein
MADRRGKDNTIFGRNGGGGTGKMKIRREALDGRDSSDCADGETQTLGCCARHTSFGTRYTSVPSNHLLGAGTGTLPDRQGCRRIYSVVTPNKNNSITNIVKTISFIAYTTPKKLYERIIPEEAAKVNARDRNCWSAQ